MPPQLRGSPPKIAGAPAPAPAGASDFEQRRLEAQAKIEEMNRKRSEAEQRKAAYAQWLAENEEGADDGILVTDEGIHRTKAYERKVDQNGPDPPRGRDSMVNHWKTDMLQPDWGTYAARQSVRQGVENGVLTQQIGFDKHGTFHPVRHFHAGSAYERYRRGMPPGYMGHIPFDAVPVTGGKIGVIEKKHPIMYSTVRPATGAVVADILDDKFDASWAAEDDEIGKLQ